MAKLLSFTKIIFLLLFSLAAWAQPFTCTPKPFLANGFSLENYQQCKKVIATCPNNGPFPDIDCVNKVTAKHPFCTQLTALSDAIGTEPSLITAESYPPLTVIDRFFPGDGQDQYYIISADGCLIDSFIDPRGLNNAVKRKNKGTPFIITSGGDPTVQRNPDGTQTVKIKLRISDGCVACEIIGWATITLQFDKQGKVVDSSLEKFTHDDD